MKKLPCWEQQLHLVSKLRIDPSLFVFLSVLGLHMKGSDPQRVTAFISVIKVWFENDLMKFFIVPLGSSEAAGLGATHAHRGGEEDAGGRGVPRPQQASPHQERGEGAEESPAED